MTVRRWSLMTREEQREYAAELNRVQAIEEGVPQRVEDPVVAERIARILTAPIVDDHMERAS